MHAFLDHYADHVPLFLSVAQGELLQRPRLVHTVLGSCVSVTFFVPSRGLAAMFHALLPRAQDYHLTKKDTNPYKFVDSAIRLLAERLARRGVNPMETECKVFGGASAMFPQELSVGRRNVETAFVTLAELGFRVAASNVGGERGRKILFASGTGEVFVKMFKGN